mmetsp:Transcript_33288/g.49334  ORF Transcript_33288/g.49334 Transcript_33288/m.49334 type:complete len:81 (+) Transcript_33288:1336-1578(+)
MSCIIKHRLSAPCVAPALLMSERPTATCISNLVLEYRRVATHSNKTKRQVSATVLGGVSDDVRKTIAKQFTISDTYRHMN